jgi:hypothetical protein
MSESHNIDDAERELIGFAIKQLRDRCNQTLNWLYPPPKPPEPPVKDDLNG